MGIAVRVGQRWWHPGMGYGHTPGEAVITDRAMAGTTTDDPAMMWWYRGDDGTVGGMTEDDLLAAGRLVED